jgi:tRNA threonylcarbamoyladenosine biosynthesis protein TsaB
MEEWLTTAHADAWVSGPVLEKLALRLPGGTKVVDRQYWHPTAKAVGRLAFQHYQAGRRDDVYQLVPQYFRRSAAEEKWEARGM